MHNPTHIYDVDNNCTAKIPDFAREWIRSGNGGPAEMQTILRHLHEHGWVALDAGNGGLAFIVATDGTRPQAADCTVA
jgi:hypothetical protein